MTKDDLQRFCCPDPERGKLNAPWSEGDFSYATSGHILIKVPRLEDELTGKGIDLSRVATTLETEPATWYPLPTFTAAPIGCSFCRGTGWVYTCPECDGHGQVCAQTDFSTYDGLDCNTCGGHGQLSKAAWLQVMDGRLRRGAATEKDAMCDHCYGTGLDWPDTGEAIGEAYFAHRLLALLLPLLGVEVGPFGEKDAARFRFDGGEGLIMPKLKPLAA